MENDIQKLCKVCPNNFNCLAYEAMDYSLMEPCVEITKEILEDLELEQRERE